MRIRGVLSTTSHLAVLQMSDLRLLKTFKSLHIIEQYKIHCVERMALGIG